MRTALCLMAVVSVSLGQNSFRFDAHPIADQAPGLRSVTISDISGDGRGDVFASGQKPEVWFENPGWNRHIVPEGTPIHLEFPEQRSPFGSVNRVRHLAVISGPDRHAKVLLQPVKRPDPQQGTLAEPEILPNAQWTESAVLAGAFHAFVWADFDDDGSDELVLGGDRLSIYDRGANGEWDETRIAHGVVDSIDARDLTGDGLPDLVAANTSGSVTVYTNESHLSWKRHVIATGYVNQTAIAADFTGDGRTDVIVSEARADRSYLYAAPDWKPVILQTRTRAIHSAVIDVDGDGDLDYIGARYTPGLVFWLENPQEPFTDAWPFHVIDDFEQGGLHGVHGLITGDVNGDGVLDLVAGSGQPTGDFANSLAWFRIPDHPRTAAGWERHIVARGDAPGLNHYVGVGDASGDGRADVAAAAKVGEDGNWFAWWEQPEDSQAVWTKHMLSDNEPGATNILIGDVNSDGHNDFIASRGHGVGLVWFEGQSGAPHQINTDLIGPHSLAVGDIDGDGDLDAATCAKDSYTAAWFENDGAGGFTTHHIHEHQASYDIRLADMDGDGDLDLLNAGQESQNVVWFENRLTR